MPPFIWGGGKEQERHQSGDQRDDGQDVEELVNRVLDHGRTSLYDPPVTAGRAGDDTHALGPVKGFGEFLHRVDRRLGEIGERRMHINAQKQRREGQEKQRILEELNKRDAAFGRSQRARADADPQRLVVSLTPEAAPIELELDAEGLAAFLGAELGMEVVARVDAENNLLMIRGAVPGANGSVVIVRKSTKLGTKKR